MHGGGASDSGHGSGLLVVSMTESLHLVDTTSLWSRTRLSEMVCRFRVPRASGECMSAESDAATGPAWKKGSLGVPADDAAEAAELAGTLFVNIRLVVQPGTCRQHPDGHRKTQWNGSMAEAETRVRATTAGADANTPNIRQRHVKSSPVWSQNPERNLSAMHC